MIECEDHSRIYLAVTSLDRSQQKGILKREQNVSKREEASTQISEPPPNGLLAFLGEIIAVSDLGPNTLLKQSVRLQSSLPLNGNRPSRVLHGRTNTRVPAHDV